MLQTMQTGFVYNFQSLGKFLNLTYGVLYQIPFVVTFLQSFWVKAIGNAEQYIQLILSAFEGYLNDVGFILLYFDTYAALS